MPNQHAQKKKVAAVAAIAVLILVIIFAVRGGNKSDSGITDASLVGKVEAYRVLQNGEPTGAAYVTVAFARKSSDYAFVNVAIDLNKDGTFAAYSLQNGNERQEEWITKNMPVKIMPEGNAFSFDLLDRTVDTNRDFKTSVALTKLPLTDWTGAAPADSAVGTGTIASFATDDFGKLVSPSPEGTGGAPSEKPTHGGPLNKTNVKEPDPEKYLSDVTAAPAGQGSGSGEAPFVGAVPASGPPTAGADFSVFQTDVPDMTQGVNECVPTSTSDALHWLGNRYGFKDRLPDQRATMEELKPDFHWTAADGVLVEPYYLSGKSAFIARHNLPVYTHQIGAKFDDKMAENIAAELAKGQAVEVVIGYYEWNAAQNKWVRNGGHMISAVGAFGSNGSTYLGLHDPASPGTTSLDIYETQKSRMMNYRYRGKYATFIEYAIAESPTEEWVAAHPPSTAIETTGGIVEARDAQDVWFVDALKIGTAWYPVAQFHTFTGPECDKAQHWHANTGAAVGLDLKGLVAFDFNPTSVRTRSAQAVDWKDPGECGAGKVTQVERGNIMISKEESERLAAKAMSR